MLQRPLIGRAGAAGAVDAGSTRAVARVAAPRQRPARTPPTRCPAAGEGGVSDLLRRDRRQVDLADDAFAADTAAAAPPAEAAAADAASTSASGSSTAASSSSSRRSRPAGLKSRRQRQADIAKAADAAAEGVAGDGPRFKRCKDALDAGLAAFAAKDYQGAIALFSASLELPGNGAYRLSGSPREYACPSDAEEHAALYNMACAYAQLGQAAAALTCVEAVLEAGFRDVATLQSDPDLAPIRGPQLSALINKHTGIGGLFSKLLSKKDEPTMLVSDDDKNKPWLLW